MGRGGIVKGSNTLLEKQSGSWRIRSNWKTISTTPSRSVSKGSAGREGWRGVAEATWSKP